MVSRLVSIATPRTLVLLIMLCILFVAVFIVSPASPSADLERIAPGIGLLDARWRYSPGDAYQALEAYGEAGRRLYLKRILPVDMVFPPLYALTLWVALWLCLRRALPESHLLRVLAWLPFAAGLADYLENLSVMSLLFAYPRRLVSVATLAGFATPIKLSLFSASVFLAMICPLILILRRMIHESSPR